MRVSSPTTAQGPREMPKSADKDPAMRAGLVILIAGVKAGKSDAEIKAELELAGYRLGTPIKV